jgi:hypothetical protein
MRWSWNAPWLVLACWLPACSTDHDDCSCSITTAMERRSLSCGTSACVDGVRLACVNQAEIMQRGACSAAPTDSSAPAQPAPDDSSTGIDTGCSDLQSYCDGNCRSPAATSADCQATAAAQNNDACRQWLLASAVLCHP